MKLFFIIFLVFGISSGHAFSQSFIKEKDSLNKHYKKYLQKEVYYFLLDDSIRKYKSTFLSDEPPFILSNLTIMLNNGVYIRLYFNGIKFQKNFNKDRNWDKNLIYKEKINKIFFYENDDEHAFEVK